MMKLVRKCPQSKVIKPQDLGNALLFSIYSTYKWFQEVSRLIRHYMLMEAVAYFKHLNILESVSC